MSEIGALGSNQAVEQARITLKNDTATFEASLENVKGFELQESTGMDQVSISTSDYEVANEVATKSEINVQGLAREYGVLANEFKTMASEFETFKNGEGVTEQQISEFQSKLDAKNQEVLNKQAELETAQQNDEVAKSDKNTATTVLARHSEALSNVRESLGLAKTTNTDDKTRMDVSAEALSVAESNAAEEVQKAKESKREEARQKGSVSLDEAMEIYDEETSTELIDAAKNRINMINDKAAAGDKSALEEKDGNWCARATGDSLYNTIIDGQRLVDDREKIRGHANQVADMYAKQENLVEIDGVTEDDIKNGKVPPGTVIVYDKVNGEKGSDGQIYGHVMIYEGKDENGVDKEISDREKPVRFNRGGNIRAFIPIPPKTNSTDDTATGDVDKNNLDGSDKNNVNGNGNGTNGNNVNGTPKNNNPTDPNYVGDKNKGDGVPTDKTVDGDPSYVGDKKDGTGIPQDDDKKSSGRYKKSDDASGNGVRPQDEKNPKGATYRDGHAPDGGKTGTLPEDGGIPGATYKDGKNTSGTGIGDIDEEKNGKTPDDRAGNGDGEKLPTTDGNVEGFAIDKDKPPVTTTSFKVGAFSSHEHNASHRMNGTWNSPEVKAQGRAEVNQILSGNRVENDPEVTRRMGMDDRATVMNIPDKVGAYMMNREYTVSSLYTLDSTNRSSSQDNFITRDELISDINKAKEAQTKTKSSDPKYQQTIDAAQQLLDFLDENGSSGVDLNKFRRLIIENTGGTVDFRDALRR